MWYLLVPVLLGVVLGAIGALVPRLRRSGAGAMLDRRSATLTLTAAGASCLVMIAIRIAMGSAFFAGVPSSFPWAFHAAIRFALPLALGILVVLALAVPARRASSPEASLTPRRWTSFLPPSRLAISASVLVLVLVITVAAGLASAVDEDGHHTRYLVELGTASMETSFYGWHYSIVPLLLLATLIATTLLAWSAIARPPHTEHLTGDVAARRLRSSNVAHVATGAMLLHLATVLTSLHDTASASLTVHAESGEFFRSGAPFASLSPVLQGGALLAEVIGLGLWVLVALSAVRRTRLPDRATSGRRSPSRAGRAA